MITFTGLDDFPTAGDAIELADGRTLLCCTHMPTPGTSEIAYSALYLVSGNTAAKIGQSEPYGKDIASWVTVVGTKARLWVTEPPPGGSGAAARLDRYDVEIGVGVAGGVASTIDAVARQQIAQLRTYFRNTP